MLGGHPLTKTYLSEAFHDRAISNFKTAIIYLYYYSSLSFKRYVSFSYVNRFTNGEQSKFEVRKVSEKEMAKLIVKSYFEDLIENFDYPNELLDFDYE